MHKKDENYEVLPKFISLDGGAREIKIQTKSLRDEGDYYFQVRATLNSYVYHSQGFLLHVYLPNKKPPYFTKPLKNIIMTAGKVLNFKFPTISDSD